MEKISTFAGCHPATQPKSMSSRSRRVCLQLLLLLVLESSQYPSRRYPEDVALLVGFKGKYPSTCYVILRFELPHFNEVKKPHCQSRISTRFFWALAPAACPQVAIQRSSMYLVWELSVTSLRHSHSCTLGLVVKLFISCCSPVSVIRKQNPGCRCKLVCVTVQCSSLVRI